MKSSLSIIFITVIGFSCTENLQKTIAPIIDGVKTEFAPDKRTALFNAEITDGNPAIIYGETNLVEAKDTLFARLKRHDIQAIDSILVLPDKSVKKPWAIINVSVANLRSAPAHSAELSTQALLGSPVRVLKQSRGWCLVQTPDEYIAWTNEESLQFCSSAEMSTWKNHKKVIYTQTIGFAMDTLRRNRVSDLVVGNILALQEETTGRWKVAYPDGRIAIIPKNEAVDWQQWKEHNHARDSSIIHEASQFLGIPYLWGGTSAKGMDCSGFTKTVFMLQGIILPRDASQQVHIGELIDSTGEFQNLKPGDLLFFGNKNTDGTERVVHVGLWMGKGQFIHASGDVHVSSMDSTDGRFDQFNRQRYLRSKRINIDEEVQMANLFDEF